MFDALISWLGTKIYKIAQWVIDLVYAILQFIETFIKVQLHEVWDSIVMSLASVITALPVPEFMVQASGAFMGLPAVFIWVATLCKLPQGLAMIMSAYAARFLLRRIPLIG